MQIYMQIREHLPRIWNHQNHSLYFMVRTCKCIYQNSGASSLSAYCCLSLIKSYSTNILSLITEADGRAASFLKESMVNSSCPSLLCHDPCTLRETDSEGREELSAPQSCFEGYSLPSAIETRSDLGGKVASWSSRCPFNYMQQASLYLLSVAELPNIMSPPELYARGTGNEEMIYKWEGFMQINQDKAVQLSCTNRCTHVPAPWSHQAIYKAQVQR